MFRPTNSALRTSSRSHGRSAVASGSMALTVEFKKRMSRFLEEEHENYQKAAGDKKKTDASTASVGAGGNRKARRHAEFPSWKDAFESSKQGSRKSTTTLHLSAASAQIPNSRDKNPFYDFSSSLATALPKFINSSSSGGPSGVKKGRARDADSLTSMLSTPSCVLEVPLDGDFAFISHLEGDLLPSEQVGLRIATRYLGFDGPADLWTKAIPAADRTEGTGRWETKVANFTPNQMGLWRYLQWASTVTRGHPVQDTPRIDLAHVVRIIASHPPKKITKQQQKVQEQEGRADSVVADLWYLPEFISACPLDSRIVYLNITSAEAYLSSQQAKWNGRGAKGAVAKQCAESLYRELLASPLEAKSTWASMGLMVIPVYQGMQSLEPFTSVSRPDSSVVALRNYYAAQPDGKRATGNETEEEVEVTVPELPVLRFSSELVAKMDKEREIENRKQGVAKTTPVPAVLQFSPDLVAKMDFVKAEAREALEKQKAQKALEKEKAQKALEKERVHRALAHEKAKAQKILDKEKAQKALERERAQKAVEKEKAQKALEKERAQRVLALEKAKAQKILEKEKAQKALEKERAQKVLEKERAQKAVEKEKAQKALEKEARDARANAPRVSTFDSDLVAKMTNDVKRVVMASQEIPIETFGSTLVAKMTEGGTEEPVGATEAAVIPPVKVERKSLMQMYLDAIDAQGQVAHLQTEADTTTAAAAPTLQPEADDKSKKKSDLVGASGFDGIFVSNLFSGNPDLLATSGGVEGNTITRTAEGVQGKLDALKADLHELTHSRRQQEQQQQQQQQQQQEQEQGEETEDPTLISGFNSFIVDATSAEEPPLSAERAVEVGDAVGVEGLDLDSLLESAVNDVAAGDGSGNTANDSGDESSTLADLQNLRRQLQELKDLEGVSKTTGNGDVGTGGLRSGGADLDALAASLSPVETELEALREEVRRLKEGDFVIRVKFNTLLQQAAAAKKKRQQQTPGDDDSNEDAGEAQPDDDMKSF